MSIELSSELAELVPGKVAGGRYKSAADVLKDALRLLEEQELYTTLHSNEIREKIRQGYDSVRARSGVDGEIAFERMEKELEAIECTEA
jgi:antitoxin ParD1/3/4